MTEIRLLEKVGSFAENKDEAKKIRTETIVPALEKGEDVTLDFAGIDSATQSFIHALISGLMRKYGAEVLDRIFFKNCSQTVSKLIELVTSYMQDAT